MGEPAFVAQDDDAALSGHQGKGDSGDRGRRRHAGAHRVRRVLGKERPCRRRRRRSALLDVFVPPGKRKTLKVEVERHAFAYVFEGTGIFTAASQPIGILSEKQVDGNEILIREKAGDRSLVLFDSGDEIAVQAGNKGVRFLLVSGKPIQEPVAWYGPIVMNTQTELQQAFSELRNGTFIKDRTSGPPVR